MRWVLPEASKKSVKRAGEILIDKESTEEQKLNAMEILSNWRAAHAYPMHAVLMFLRRKSLEVDNSSIVVQRLKRTPSIVRKLKRYPQMKLHRMQDISGCRSVVKSVKKAEELSLSIINSRTRHNLHKIDNYIENPKASGYRSIHLVYKYNGDKHNYKDFFVEIQLRSRIQHAWATAVEIVDAFTKQALKSSHGKQDWIDFFRYVSCQFSILESRPKIKELSNADTLPRLISLEKKLNAIARFKAFAVSAQYMTKKNDNKSDFFLLELDSKKNEILVSQYSTDELNIATEKYLEKENRARHENEYDVVLVAAKSVHDLKTAYPNYFADSKEFLKFLDQAMTVKAI